MRYWLTIVKPGEKNAEKRAFVDRLVASGAFAAADYDRTFSEHVAKKKKQADLFTESTFARAKLRTSGRFLRNSSFDTP